LNAGALTDAARIVAGEEWPSLIGRSFGHYTVLALLGSGGMGEVYRARDVRLGREVALKTLPWLAKPGEGATRQFETEARVVASLSHPNVRALYDVGEIDGRLYAVMELLEGETLRERLCRRPLPFRKAVEIGTAIAEGLAAAHSKGIVHRDLKPENVFITTAGHVKVLDFGIAKMRESRHEGVREEQAASRPMQGLLGTASYTSPEQVSGGDVDTRSDLFSFGCVLYEMVAGRRAFERSTPAETLSAIATEEPAELSAVRPDLWRIIVRCLEKEREARFQSARDLAFALSALPESGTDPTANSTIRERRRRLAWWLVAPGAAVVITAIAASMWPGRERAAPIHSYLVPPANTEFCAECGIALSPDGRRLAFVARETAASARSLWVQSLDDSSSRSLVGTDSARFPFWSPDSRAIGFFSGDALMRIDVTGASPQRLCSPCTGQGTWGENGQIVFGSAGNPLRAVSASGGNPFPITELDPAQSDDGHMHPLFLPGGRHVLFRKGSPRKPQSRAIHAVSLDSKATTLVSLVPGNITAQSKIFVAAGRLLFVQQGTLMAVPFDEARLRVEGVAEPVAQTAGPFAVAGDVLVYTQRTTLQLAWLGRDGRELEALPIHGEFSAPKLSHDGRRVAVTKVAGAAGGADIWVYDLARGHSTRLTTDPADDTLALWSPDDDWIIFSSNRLGRWDLYRKRSNGAGSEEMVSLSGFHGEARSWSADGKSLIANDQSMIRWTTPASAVSDLWHLSLPDGRATVLSRTSSREWAGEISPDGRYIAYSSDETGQGQIYVQTLPLSGQRWTISNDGGLWPKWRRDGRELFFVDVNQRRLMVADIHSGPAFAASVARPLFAAPMLQEQTGMFDVTADGQRFLVTKQAPDADTGRIALVLNWMTTLKR
jgi:eukaryotic-like serine/threonine-protein kinase